MADDRTIPAELLKLVQRNGKAIPAKQVFGWKEYEDRVVVVTTDGQKYSGAKPAAK